MKVSGKWHAELQSKRFDRSRALSINTINLNVIIIILIVIIIININVITTCRTVERRASQQDCIRPLSPSRFQSGIRPCRFGHPGTRTPWKDDDKGGLGCEQLPPLQKLHSGVAQALA